MMMDIFPDRTTARIYERANAEQWQMDDIPWADLDLQAVAPPIKAAMATLYADLLQGEQLGLRLAGRVVDRAPEGWLRRFAATQAMDEARHMEFFSAVVQRLEMDSTPSDALAELHEALLSSHDNDEVMLSAFVLESAAQVFFTEGAKQCEKLQARAIRLPGSAAIATVLDSVCRYVGRDESRHVAFGMAYLRARVALLSPARRRALHRRVTEHSALLREVVRHRAAAYARLGIGPMHLIRRVEATQKRQLVQLGFDPVED